MGYQTKEKREAVMNTSRIDKLNEDAKRTERVLDLIMEARRVAL